MRRHELCFVRPSSWSAALTTRAEIATDPLVAGWADRGWPLIGRRPMCNEGEGVPLGLPLPPAEGKRRLSFLLPQPPSWRRRHRRCCALLPRSHPAAGGARSIDLDALAAERGVEARVFGSLAWGALTGLPYVTRESDLDLLLQVRRDTDLDEVTDELAAIEQLAPMRIDGELVREDGVAVNWRELRSGAREVLGKTDRGIALFDARRFRSMEPVQ